MKLKELIHFAGWTSRNASIQINGSEDFNVELKYNSVKGWIIEFKTEKIEKLLDNSK